MRVYTQRPRLWSTVVILVAFCLPLIAMLWFFLSQRFVYDSGHNVWGEVLLKAIIGGVLGGMLAFCFLPLCTVMWDFNGEVIYRRYLFGMPLFRKVFSNQDVKNVTVISFYHKSFGAPGTVVYAVQIRTKTGRKYEVVQTSTPEQADETKAQIESAIERAIPPSP